MCNCTVVPHKVSLCMSLSAELHSVQLFSPHTHTHTHTVACSTSLTSPVPILSFVVFLSRKKSSSGICRSDSCHQWSGGVTPVQTCVYTDETFLDKRLFFSLQNAEVVCVTKITCVQAVLAENLSSTMHSLIFK